MFNWKLIKYQILALRFTKTESVDLIFIIIVLLLFGGGGYLYFKQYNEKIFRRFIQIFSLFVFGILFSQCLCITKDVALSFKILFKSSILSMLTSFWFPFVVIISVIILGKNFYCYWICPLGFIQELAGYIKIFKSYSVKTTILIFMLAINILVIWYKKPTPFIMAGGAWLSLGLLVFLILITAGLLEESRLSAFKFGIFIIWFIIPIILSLKLSGPWCVIGKANLAYTASVPFVIVGVSSMLVLRGWCQFICPDGALFHLLQFLRKIPKALAKRRKKSQ